MKRGALDHPKTLELNAKLNEPLRATWGLLEALTHYVGKYAMAGDIGKWSDASIAIFFAASSASLILVVVSVMGQLFV